MRILQQFPVADDPSLAGALSGILQRIIAVRGTALAPHGACMLRGLTRCACLQLGAEAVKNVNKNNALQAVRISGTRHMLQAPEGLTRAASAGAV
jgi:hypothetical protein